jgi:2-methylisocitrate lyase-like PEP mutase family enzyme
MKGPDIMSSKQAQETKARLFLELHRAPSIFVLANAWDVPSARIFEMAGFRAIGTTSYGLAASMGLHDGQQVTRQDTVGLVRRLVGRVNVPLSADIEAGYAETIEGVVETARSVLNVGAVGINLEDSTGNHQMPLYDIHFQQEKISAIRDMADTQGVHLLINARIDTYLEPSIDQESRLSQTIARGNAYRKAGADCVFVPDMGDLNPATMKTLVEEIEAPINIIAGEFTPPMAVLQEIGITRVSLGPRVMRAAFGLHRRIAREILDNGTFSSMLTGALSYEEASELLG